MHLAIIAAAWSALSLPAFAQQGQPARPPAGQRPPAQQPQPPAPPPIFLCRTVEEVCTLGIVTGKNQIVVIFTNAPGAEGVEKPIDVFSGDGPGSPLDLSQNVGGVVLLTGAYDPKAGMTKAVVVEAAGPLVSTLIKAQVAGSADDGPPRGGKPAAQKKR